MMRAPLRTKIQRRHARGWATHPAVLQWGLKLRRAAPWMLWSVAAVWMWHYLASPTTLAIQHVRVNADLQHITQAEVQQLVAPVLQGGFFNVDLVAIHAAVATLPWAEKVSVRRGWPDTVYVDITERRAVARWAAGGLVAADGRVFTPAPHTYPAGLPEFSGPPQSALQMLLRYRPMVTTLRAQGLRIVRAQLDARYAWKLYLDNNIELILGRDPDERLLARFARVYGVALASRAMDVAQVDLRYTHGLAVLWRDELPNS